MNLDAALAPISSEGRPLAPGLVGSSARHEHLIFQLHGALYAIDALEVREVHKLPELTPLAEGAPFVAGVINLRGRIVPVMDLALRLGQKPQPCRVDDCLIVLQQGEACLALIANDVRAVQSISDSQIEAVPFQVPGPDAPLLRGVAKVQDEVVMLLSTGGLLQAAPEEAAQVLGGLRFSTEHLSLDERAVLRERARRLMASSQEEASGALLPIALVMLHGEVYGLGLGTVREFCELRHVAPVPCCPPHVLGQMNLRGDIVTLLDIQPLLQMPARHEEPRSSVVVVQHEGALVGVVVDEVQDVLYISEQQAAAGASSQAANAKYFDGAVLHGNKLVCLLDLPCVLAEGSLVVDETV